MSHRIKLFTFLMLALTGCADLLGANFDDLPTGTQTSGGHRAAGGAATGGTGGHTTTSANAGSGGGGSGGGGGNGGSGGSGIGKTLPVTCGDMSALQSGAPWPMAGYCPTRQGRSPAKGFLKPKIRWQVTLPTEINSEPVVAADGAVYVSTVGESFGDGGRFYKVVEGVAMWFRQLVAPAITIIGKNGTIYLHDGGHVVQLTPDNVVKKTFATGVARAMILHTDGSLYTPGSGGIWKTTQGGTSSKLIEVGGDFRSLAVGLDGTLYAGSVGGRLIAVDLSGKLKWSFDALAADGISRDMPVVGDADTIYFTTDKRVYALNAAGQEKWSFSTGKFATVTPSVFGGVLLAVSINDMNKHTLWAVGPDGVPLWSVPSAGIMGRPALSSDGLMMSFVSNTLGSTGRVARARLPGSGAIAWALDLDLQNGLGWQNAAYGADGVLYLVSHKTLYAIESE